MKTALKILSAIILGFILGWYAEIWYTSHFLHPEIKDIENKIENLESRDSIIEKEKVIIKDSIITLWKEKEIRVDSIKKLPLDSGINFLKTKLEEYE